MANVGIFRVNKIKTQRDLTGVAKHHLRERTPENANKTRTLHNEVNPSWLGVAEDTPATSSEVRARWREITKDVTVRSNAVQVVDLLVTVPSEDMNQKTRTEQRDFFKDSYEWIVKKHGAENVLLATTHEDEIGPHMHVLVTPMKDGRLNARDFYGGKSKKMREIQDDFYEKVSRRHGLERGTPRERTRWRDSAEFSRDLKEAPKKFVGRLNEFMVYEESSWESTIVKEMDTAKKLLASHGYKTENPLIAAYVAGIAARNRELQSAFERNPDMKRAIQLAGLEEDRHRKPLQQEQTTQQNQKGFSKEREGSKIDRSGPGRGSGGLGIE